MLFKMVFCNYPESFALFISIFNPNAPGLLYKWLLWMKTYDYNKQTPKKIINTCNHMVVCEWGSVYQCGDWNSPSSNDVSPSS